MIKIYFWLILLQISFSCDLMIAADEREHVHIKVHIPEMVKKHTHFRKVQKHYYHPKKIHGPELDSLFAGGSLGGHSFLPANLYEPLEYASQDYPSYMQSMSMYPPELPPPPPPPPAPLPQIAALNSDGNTLTDVFPRILKPKMKFTSFDAARYFPKVQGKRVHDYSYQYGRTNGNANGNSYGNYFDDTMPKFPFESEEEEDDDDDVSDDTYTDDMEMKSAEGGGAMHDQPNIYSYAPEAMATPVASNLKTKWAAYPQNLPVGDNSLLKWQSGGDGENYPQATPEWMTAQSSLPSSDDYTMHHYANMAMTDDMPLKKKKQHRPLTHRAKLTPTESVFSNLDHQALLPNDRWISKKKKVKSEKSSRRRHPTRGSSASSFRINY